jgi:ArsR family metal-binding transcriptional regulator
VEVVEVRQLLPCIADSSKFRVIANLAPPLSGTLKVLEPFFAREALGNLMSIINEVIAKGVAPAPREKVRVEPMEIYKYLPQTNCGKCSEQSCYTFAIKLMSGETSLEKCTPLKEPGYAPNQEHLQVLAAYI